MPKLKVKSWRPPILAALHILLFILLFWTNPIISAPKSNLVLLFLLMLVSWWCLFFGSGSVLLQKYRTRGRITGICLIAVYSSLASFGHRLLNMDESRMSITWSGALYLLIGALWFIPILLLILYLLERIVNVPVRSINKSFSRPKLWLALFGVLSAIQCVLLLSFAPGGYGNDGVYEYMQAIGALPLDDWHPIMNALMERLLLKIVPSPVFITFVQMELFAFLVTEFLMIAYDAGFRPRTIIIVGALFMLLPNQVMNSITIVKDMPYLFTIMGSTLLLFKALKYPGYESKPRFWIGMALCLFFMVAYRHNGILPAAILLISCVILTAHLMKKQRHAWKMMIGPILAVVMLVIYKGPVTASLKVQANTSSPYVTMLCGVANVISNDLPLSDEATAIMEEVMPLSEWKEYYSRYEGHDRYMWDRDGQTFDTSSVTLAKAFRVYLEALFRYPDVVLKDRLDGMDIMWDLRQPDDSFNVRYFDYVDDSFGIASAVDLSSLTLEDDGHWYSRTPIAELYRKLCDARTYVCAENMLLWRSGAYIILMLLLFVFWQAHGMKQMWAAAIPFLANLFCSVLGVYHQSFRYVYYIQVLVLGLALMSVSLLRRREGSHTLKEVLHS